MEMQGRPPPAADHPSSHSHTHSNIAAAPQQNSNPQNNYAQTSLASTAFSGQLTSSSSTPAPTSTVSQPKKRPAAPRKKKVDEQSEDPNAEKPKKATRKPRDPNKPTARKKQKTDENSSTSSNEASTIKIAMPPTAAKDSPIYYPSRPIHNGISTSSSTMTQIDEHRTYDVLPSGSGVAPIFEIPDPPKPKPVTRGPYYDPIRGSSVTPAARVSSPSSSATRQSPSISSLMNPSEPTPRPLPASSLTFPTSSSIDKPKSNLVEHSSQMKPSVTNQGSESKVTMPSASITAEQAAPIGSSFTVAPAADAKVASSSKTKEPPAKNPSPKEPRAKEAPPLIGLGNGLLSGAAFGEAQAEPPTYAEVPNQCIVIEVPMKSANGHCYVNFMAEVEKKYGFDVAHPRLAEHRKRMKEIAAAGAAIESNPESGDEMAMDASDIDSNVEMGGMDDDSTADGIKKRKGKGRGKRTDVYDFDDDFIDDTEMIWEEQALASKDGYFVWAGPLVPADDKASTDRADGATKRGKGGRSKAAGRGGAAAKGESSRSKTANRGARSTGTGAGGRKRATKATAADVKTESSSSSAAAAKPAAVVPSTVPVAGTA